MAPKSKLWASALKEVDQMSPLFVEKMPRRWSAVLIVIVALSGVGAFGYQLFELYGNCSTDNGCIACTISLGEIDGSTCTQLAQTDLRFASGCATYSIPNDYNRLLRMIEGINRTVDLMYHEHGIINSDLYESLRRHHEVVNILRSNSQGQMIDPDPEAIAALFNKYFFGISDQTLNFGPDTLSTPQGRSLLIDFGLKVLFAYMSTGCTAYSELKETLRFTVDIGAPIPPQPLATENVSIDQVNVPSTYFQVCGCRLHCPYVNDNGELEDDVSVGALDVSMSTASLISNGFARASLLLPDKYVVLAEDARVEPRIYHPYTTLEALSDLGGEARHCASNVFTATPSQLNGVLYECCTEKSNVEKLAEVNAFTGFVLLIVVIATTLMFWPCGGTGSIEELKHAVMSTASV
eukprot:TRINITY_DN6937_c0_g1_i3.p1 TRINITY_DN6937_c0_g1~~TRINITY_DN6937_c0_g1_i3.p1  ORF type:complete len:408 (+),score=60.67 TRINITY_DN6937_c0_g1_i3:293-1516(+)